MRAASSVVTISKAIPSVALRGLDVDLRKMRRKKQLQTIKD
jgi:hypothetical protein